MVRAPYDDRNEADYEEMSGRIDAALLKIEQDEDIPATQKELARLAQCSRGTLSNRGWPVKRLNRIKEERKTAKTGRRKKATLEQRASADAHIEDKRKLLQQLNNSRDELAVWVDKYKELESENKKLTRAKIVLEKSKASLESRVAELSSELAELKARLHGARAGQIVVPLNRLSRPSDRKPLASGQKKKRKPKK